MRASGLVHATRIDRHHRAVIGAVLLFVVGRSLASQQVLEILGVVGTVAFYVVFMLGYSTIYQATVKLTMWRHSVETLAISNPRRSTMSAPRACCRHSARDLPTRSTWAASDEHGRRHLFRRQDQRATGRCGRRSANRAAHFVERRSDAGRVALRRSAKHGCARERPAAWPPQHSIVGTARNPRYRARRNDRPTRGVDRPQRQRGAPLPQEGDRLDLRGVRLVGAGRGVRRACHCGPAGAADSALGRAQSRRCGRQADPRHARHQPQQRQAIRMR